MNFASRYSCYLELLGVLNFTFSLISRDIGGAMAPTAPPGPMTLKKHKKVLRTP